jgi:hypothetical protein
MGGRVERWGGLRRDAGLPQQEGGGEDGGEDGVTVRCPRNIELRNGWHWLI